MKRATSAVLAASGVVALAACAGQTNPATSVTHDAATLHASLRCDRGERGDYWGEYRRVGTSAWTQVGRQSFDCGAGADSREESFRVGRLQPSTSYEFRVCGDLTNPNHPVLCADSAGTAHRPGDTHRPRVRPLHYTGCSIATEHRRPAPGPGGLLLPVVP
jgi:hypothetical protein